MKLSDNLQQLSQFDNVNIVSKSPSQHIPIWNLVKSQLKKTDLTLDIKSHQSTLGSKRDNSKANQNMKVTK
jgi:hypothetical protein